ncbi:hypothetical protein PRZ48_008724 [Zasmidium cellare]|uniref:Uncharacterized protein n=1 Tax=Zasmidium cellare TaxID=395010 RepID=A0ABR0EHB3_ZASCE|nr:hypothetical protein PRZ48_008724 [Zasmidium cellare]
MTQRPNELSLSSRHSTPFDELADQALECLDGLINMSAEARSLDLGKQDFTIDRIGERRVTDGVSSFEVHWSKTEVPRRLITRSKDSKTVVRCNGKECEVLSHTRVREGPDEIRLVEWKPTWLSRQELQRLGHEPEPSDKDESDTPRPRKRRKRVSVQIDVSAGLSSAQSTPAKPKSSELQQAMLKWLRLQPKACVSYTKEMRSLLRNCGFGSVQELVERRPRNEIVFRDRFVDHKSFFNVFERKGRIAAALQMAGVSQRRECGYCSRGNGPFDKCVVLREYNRSACANCVYGSIATSCNYHVETHATGGPWTPTKASRSTNADVDEEDDSPSPDPPPRRRSKKARSSAMRTRQTADEVRPEDGVEDAFASKQTPARTGEQTTTTTGKLKKLKRKVAGVVIDRNAEGTEGPEASSSQPPLNSILAIRPSSEESTDTAQLRWRLNRVASSSLNSEWRTNYLTPDFRHDMCPPAPSPCEHLIASDHRPESELRPVRRGRVFERGEASPEEVRWLIQHSDCCMTELMSRAWLHRLGQRKESPLPKGCTKESFLSQWHPGKLNTAAAMFGIE